MRPIYFYTTDITIKAGIERITINLANYFTQNNIPVTIVSNFKTNENPAYDFDSRVKFVYLNEVKFVNGIGSSKRLKQFLGNITKVKEYFSKIKKSIIITQAFPNSFIYWLACGKKNKNTVYTVEHVEYYYYKKLIRILRYFVYKFYNNVVVLTEADKKCYENLKINVSLIPNGIKLPTIKENKQRKKTVCSIGRLDPPKKFDSLMKAFSIIASKYSEWNLEIYGQGSIRNELERLIVDLNLSNRITLKGITDDVNSVLQENSIFAVSSEYEGFSIVLIEAMANGIACVSYDCPTGPGEIITDGIDGILVENQNENKMAESIEKLILNQHLRLELGSNAIKSVQKYSIDSVGTMWIKLLYE